MNDFRLCLPPVPITHTTLCSNIDDIIQDIPPVPILDTYVCNNINNNIWYIPLLLSDTVSPQQTPVTLKLLIDSVLYSQSVAIKEFPLSNFFLCKWRFTQTME